MRIEFDEKTSIPHFPYLIRRETGLMEFKCIHGVGHPALSSIEYMNRVTGGDTWGIHGCDGCCSRDDFPDIKYIPARIEVVPKKEVST